MIRFTEGVFTGGSYCATGDDCLNTYKFNELFDKNEEKEMLLTSLKRKLEDKRSAVVAS